MSVVRERDMLQTLTSLGLWALMNVFTAVAATGAQPVSHPAMRPLPVPSLRPLVEGPVFFVDALRGDNRNAGTQDHPWKTLQFALEQLSPGDTLYLRQGIYYEHVVVPGSGEDGEPITVRGYPGELAIIDGGHREFIESPETAWQPVDGGADGEFVSAREYSPLLLRPVPASFLAEGWEPFHGKEDERPLVLGHFADSMVPLHSYRTVTDLRDDSMLWDVEEKFDATEGVYCGPGLWYNRDTQRIHIRLRHTTLEGLGSHAYGGETDPRKLPLIIAGPSGDDVLRLNGVRNYIVQDIVLRGASYGQYLWLRESEF
jgi:hypothetical protein